MKRWLAVPQQSSFADFALLVIRLVAGVAFMMHGFEKIQNPFGWMGPDSFAAAPFRRSRRSRSSAAGSPGCSACSLRSAPSASPAR